MGRVKVRATLTGRLRVAPIKKSFRVRKIIPLSLFIGTLVLLGLLTMFQTASLSKLAVHTKSSFPSPTLITETDTNPSTTATNALIAPDTNSLSPGVTFPAGAGSSSTADTKDVMRAVVSLSILGSSLFIILRKKYDANDKKWAYGSVGAILGYWLGG